MLRPKLLTTLKDYSAGQFFRDILAGIVVGIVAVPLAIAFAIASGVSPDRGLVTAIVAGFLISALGGSRVQIGGPTGAFVVIVYGIVQHHGVDGLITATFMAGILLLILGCAGLGTVIKFVPHPVTIGFTSGIAVIIFSSQIKDFFGLQMKSVPADFIEKIAAISRDFSTMNPYALAIALGTVLIVAFWPRVSRKVPGSMMALLLSVLTVQFFHWPVETIGSRFGGLPTALPKPVLPGLDFAMIKNLIQPALAITFLGAIESLLSAVVADGMIGGRHRSNMELVAQGIANLASSVFGGIPATGAIARTATNVKNGGRTPVAGMVHALVVLLIVLCLGKWVKLIPLACLAGILAVVSYNMSEWRSFAAVVRGLKSGAAVLLITFAVTVLFDLTVAIEIGMILSVFIFMHRMSKATKVRLIEGTVEKEEFSDLDKIKVPKGVEVYEINGPLFFGVAHEFEEAVRAVAPMPKVRVLRLRHVPIIDTTGLEALKEFYEKCRKSHVELFISGIQPQPLRAVKQYGLYEKFGPANFFETIEDALEAASQRLGGTGGHAHG